MLAKETVEVQLSPHSQENKSESFRSVLDALDQIHQAFTPMLLDIFLGSGRILVFGSKNKEKGTN